MAQIKLCKNSNLQNENDRAGEMENIKQFWTEHRTTLIAYETQYVYAKKPLPVEEEQTETKVRRKPKKKEMEYDSGFLFHGRGDQKQINVQQLISESKYNHLRELFSPQTHLSEDMQQLREFIKIMLELKHHSIIRQFMEIYDLIVREIKDVKFEAVKAEINRENLIKRIADMIASFIKAFPHSFKIFSGYLREDEKETVKLFKVTAYCFLAQKHCFNINEYYADAFDYQLEERKAPKKKRKMDA